MLVAMATGTGKTITCIGLVYRLIKTGRFRRVLFLVDRSALANKLPVHSRMSDSKTINLSLTFMT